MFLSVLCHFGNWQLAFVPVPSQRSLHDAPIFRLLLKVAVNGTHQCDFLNFCGASGLQCGGNTLQWNLAWPWGCGALTLL